MQVVEHLDTPEIVESAVGRTGVTVLDKRARRPLQFHVAGARNLQNKAIVDSRLHPGAQLTTEYFGSLSLSEIRLESRPLCLRSVAELGKHVRARVTVAQFLLTPNICHFYLYSLYFVVYALYFRITISCDYVSKDF